jgi:molybdopterin-binding protein
MLLSASNQLRGRIVEIQEGPVSTRVILEIAPKVRVTSVITTASAKRLGLKVGRKAIAIIKATEVILGTETK